MDLLEKRQDLRNKAQILFNSTSELVDILEAGRYCMVCLYGLAKDIQQNKLSRVGDLSKQHVFSNKFDVLHVENKSFKVDLLENLEINILKNTDTLLNDQLDLNTSPLLNLFT